MLAVVFLPVSVSAAAAEPAPAAPAPAPADPAERPAPDAANAPAPDAAATLEALAGSMVVVEYWLKPSTNEEPRARGVRAGADLVREERPAELAGWLIAPGKVLTPDPLVHPRFVRSIRVRLGEESVVAQVGGYAEGQAAVYLDLERPLKGGKPLAFEPAAAAGGGDAAAGREPLQAVTRTQAGGRWIAAAAPLALLPALADDGRRFAPVPANCLILGAGGAPAGVTVSPELPLDGSWRGSPLGWPVITADRMAKRLAAAEGRANRGLLRVTLEFRSPRRGSAEALRAHAHDGDEATVREAVGVVLENGRMLVLEELRPAETARLERITAHTMMDAAIPAKFVASLAEYGCLVAELNRPVPAAALQLADGDVRRFRGALLTAAEIGFYGEQRLAVYEHARITAFETRWKRRLCPLADGSPDGRFLFDPQGLLVALPVTRRAPASMVPPDPRKPAEAPRLTAAAHLLEQLADLSANGDPANVPLGEAQEGRLAWMGVILQPLNRELARMHGISVETGDGEIGALVAHVYPGSPAARAGIRPGAVLLRLHVKGQPLPIDVRLADGGAGYYYGEEEEESGAGDEDGELPDPQYQHAARPWAPAGDALARVLTDLGLGREYTAELRVGGLPLRKALKVEESPPHFDTAARHKSAELGLTVRDLTFEVRRYFQMKPEDPGVIVSTVEPGSKAAVAGIRPFEIVVAVNGRAAAGVKEFAAACEKQEELRLAVKRLARERQVKIRLPGAAAPAPVPAPAAPNPAEAPAAK